ncbi:ABC transporter ATP-binding protein [Clostridium sp. MSJ-11]|uniref:ABC transporter ATP-binding protein n=1 Tax=Clostridium mobile TaxID=2841512 RepID=A0ABS6EK27_9CLOT|nr:ABC transporter ATP-binding protein [Clostridium mobile]MBU5485565.1 ABC transporter ATP-binding protein [Clostridium mobile]
MEVLKTIGLSKTYGEGETKVDALKPTDLSINEGDFVAIVGPSGSGKSTLLHLLGGLDRPTLGKVFIDGMDIYSLSEKKLSIFRRRSIGFIFQFYNLIPVLNAEENITFPLLLDGKSIDNKYIEDLLDLLGLKDRRYHLPNELSGGQQQRVAIARALANKPSIILADEPTGNLDRKTNKEVLDLLKISTKRYHQTLIMITHDIEIASTSDRIITIEDGLIVEDRMMVK